MNDNIDIELLLEIYKKLDDKELKNKLQQMISKIIDITKLDDKELKKKLGQILSKIADNNKVGYLDICHKIQIICKKIYGKEKFRDEDYEDILKKLLKSILENHERRMILQDIICNNYVKNVNETYFLFDNCNDIDLDSLRVEQLNPDSFNRKHKKEIGFISKESIKTLFKKTACNLLVGTEKLNPEDQIEARYSEHGRFLTNFCKAYEIDIDDFFYKEKRFTTVKEYEEYIDAFFNENINEDEMSDNKIVPSSYINDAIINIELNISNEDMLELIEKFTYDEKSDRYDLNTQNINFIVKLIEKSFLRNIDNKIILELLEKINNLEFYEKNERYLVVKDILFQHKAKILSNLNKDAGAKEVLEDLLLVHEKSPDKYSLKSYIETLNLLAASYKRYCFQTLASISEQDGRNELLEKNLIKAKEIYLKAYNLPFNQKEKYYPSLNISYLELIIGYIQKRDLNETLDILDEVWKDVEIEITDYWSWISDVEKNILYQNYERAKKRIKNIEDEIDVEKVEAFHIDSTLRQLNLYMNYCNKEDKQELEKICEMLEQLKS